jgi:hypothetical protein
MKTIIHITIIGLGMLVLGGCNANGTYALQSGKTGTLAKAQASAKESGGRYAIDIKVATQGIYNLLKGKRTEHYSSKGHIRNGKYHSDRFVIERWKDGGKIHDLQEYRFDYKRRKVIKRYRKWSKGKLVEDRSARIPRFTHQDFLTVMHNALHKISKTKGARKTYITAGSEETGGKVPIYVSNDPKRLKQWGAPGDGTLVQMGIHKGIFKGGKGSMSIILDKHNRPLRFVFSNMKTIGTLTGKPIK